VTQTAVTPGAPAAAERTRRGRGRPVLGSDRAPRPGALYALPAALFFLFFAVLPLVLVVVLSFTDWNAVGDPKFTGTDNWRRLFGSRDVLTSLGRTFLLSALCWVTQTVLAMGIGVWSAGKQRNRAVLSAIFFVPLLLSAAAVALMWRSVLDPNFGVDASIGHWVGKVDGLNLLGSDRGALLCIVVVVTWQFVPFHALLYQAATRNIPQSLYDAATIDGATRWGMFRHITLPQLRNTVVTSSTIMFVGSLTYFETVLLLTDGGPGGATRVLPYVMYRTGFTNYELGYASAIATVLVMLGTGLSLLIVRFSGFAKMRSTLEGL
jgi:xylobiose transport system permease protein